jgi:hypothetical protein
MVNIRHKNNPNRKTITQRAKYNVRKNKMFGPVSPFAILMGSMGVPQLQQR